MATFYAEIVDETVDIFLLIGVIYSYGSSVGLQNYFLLLSRLVSNKIGEA